MKHWFAIFCIALGLCSSNAFANGKSCGGGCKKQSWLLFGDSLFDTGAGNNLAIKLGVPQPNPQPPYANNRHSNGPIWVDYASDLLDANFVDFAVSGSQTGSINNNSIQLGGIFQQIDRFQKHCCKVNKHTLVIMDGGANDILSIIPANITPAGAAAAVVSALGNLAVDFQRLQNLGAKKILVWNLPDLGKTPLFNDPAFGLQAAKPLFTGATIGFNAGLLQEVAAFNTFAKKHQQIFILDAFLIFNEIEAALTKAGVDLAEHTLTVLPNGTILVTGPPPNDIAFYDNIHPTTFLWQIAANPIAAYIDTIMEGNRFIAIEQDLAFASTIAHRDALNNHYRTLHLQRFNNCQDCCDEYCGCDCVQFYVDGLAKWGHYHSRCVDNPGSGTLGSEYDIQLGLFGADFRCNDCMTLGASFTFEHANAHAKKHRGHVELHDYVPTLYATLYGGCNTFVDVDVSYHFFHYDSIKRRIPFVDREAKAHTNARCLEGNFEFGCVKNCNCWTLIPIAGLGVEGIRIDNYKEKCGGIYGLKVRHQHQNSFYGKLGAQFAWNSCDCCLSPFGEIMYEHEFDRGHGLIATHFRKAEAEHSTNYTRTGRADRDLLRFTLGLDARFCSCMVANISYEGETTFRDYANGVKAQIDFNF